MTNDPGQCGYAVAVNYDLGSGSELQLGYSKSGCESEATGEITAVAGATRQAPHNGGSVYYGASGSNDEKSTLSFGVAMSF